MERTSVLISGVGIAGPALAYWLLQHGFAPTLVEQAPRLRTTGYVIDFWGAGYDVASRMGLERDVLDAGYQVDEVRFIDRDGARVSGFDVSAVRRATRGRFVSVPRGELSRLLFETVEERVETLFGDSVAQLEQSPSGVRVQFEHAPAREFGLVVGCDGLHSRVRSLVFGPERQFERYLGYVVVAFEVSGYRPRDEGVYFMYGEAGVQVSRFAMRGDRTMCLILATEDLDGAPSAGDASAWRAYLRRRLDGSGWETAAILDALDRAAEVYCDRVSQIEMDTWSRGRIGLLGDAAFAPSLMAGQGSALAMVGAYVLAGELARASDAAAGFDAYEHRLRPFLAGKQRSARMFSASMVPHTSRGLAIRNLVAHALELPGVMRLVSRGLLDEFALPDYS